MKSWKFLENANMQDAFYMYPPLHDFVNESLFFRRKRKDKERERKGIGKKENECPPIHLLTISRLADPSTVHSTAAAI